MSGRVEVTTRIKNREGLHARPSTLVVKCAHGFSAELTMSIGGRSANCRSIMEVMMLASPMGTEVSVVGEGEDAQEAVAALVDLFDRGFDEAYG